MTLSFSALVAICDPHGQRRPASRPVPTLTGIWNGNVGMTFVDRRRKSVQPPLHSCSVSTRQTICGTDLSCLHNGLYSVERFLLSICSKQCTQIRRKEISPQKCQMIGITVLPCQTTYSFMGVSDVSTIWLLRLCPPPSVECSDTVCRIAKDWNECGVESAVCRISQRHLHHRSLFGTVA
jgi:hypothetical protein